VWRRIVKRLRCDMPVAHTRYPSFDLFHQQQLLLFSVIRLETHDQFFAGGLLRVM